MPSMKFWFMADREKIHKTFYSLKQRYSDFFKEFTFNAYKMFPRSEELDQALSNLEFCGFLSKHNPFLEYYEIKIAN